MKAIDRVRARPHQGGERADPLGAILHVMQKIACAQRRLACRGRGEGGGAASHGRTLNAESCQRPPLDLDRTFPAIQRRSPLILVWPPLCCRPTSSFAFHPHDHALVHHCIDTSIANHTSFRQARTICSRDVAAASTRFYFGACLQRHPSWIRPLLHKTIRPVCNFEHKAVNIYWDPDMLNIPKYMVFAVR